MLIGWLLAGRTVAPAATQYWDTGIAAGLQGAGANAGWSVSSNAWASTGTGTTTPGTWTNGNDANFATSGGGLTVTVTVYSVSSRSIFLTGPTNGRLIFQAGSGALTNGTGGIALTATDNNTAIFNNDLVLSATQTWYDANANGITVNGLLSGANAALIKTGSGTLTLNNTANSFGGLTINNGTVTVAAGGTVAGVGPILLGTVVVTNPATIYYANLSLATLVINAGAVNVTTTLSNLTSSGASVLQMLNASANVTSKVQAATLARTGLGTLVIAPANSLGVREQMYFTGGTNLVNGILAPWVINNANGGEFVANGATGLTNATYTATFGANNVVSNSALVTLASAQQAYALKAGANINLNGNNLTLGNGTTAGLILNAATITNGGAAASLTFGTAEGLVYVGSGNTGTIAVEVSGGGGLTKFGAGALVLSNANLWSSAMTINGGAVVLSPTANLTYTNGIAGPGSLTKDGGFTLTLTNNYILGGTLTANSGTLALARGLMAVGTFTFGSGNGTLLVTNGAVFDPATGFTISGGTNALIVTGSGSMLTNPSVSVDGTGSSLTIAAGAQVINFGGSSIGTTTSSNTVLVTGGGSVWTNYGNSGNVQELLIGGGAGGGNSLIISNGGLVYLAPSTAGRAFVMGGGSGASNAVLITGSGSTWSVSGNGQIGNASGNNRVTVANGGLFTMSSFLNIGNGAVNSNIVMVTDTNSVLRLTSYFTVGNSASSGGNQLIVSNGGLVVSVGGSAIGVAANANNNSVLVTGAGSTWTNIGTVTIGGATNSGNNLTVTAGGIASVGALTVGQGPGSTNNNLLVTAGGSLVGGSAITLGQNAGANNNSFTVAGGSTSNGLITVGMSGGNYNAMLVTNASVLSSGLFIGNVADSNTVTVQADVTWDLLSGQLSFGNGTGNTLVVAPSSTVTNVGGLGLLGRGLSFMLTNNILMGDGVDVLTARVYLAGGSLTVGTTGLGDNSLTISNQTFRTGAASLIGNGASNNVLTILANTVWDGGAAGLTIGTGAATGNVLTVNGGSATNNGAVVIGASAAADGNSLVITNGGQMGGSTVTIGSVAGATNNSALVTGAGSVWSNTGVLKFGTGANNNFTAADGAQVTVDNFQTGAGTSNQFLITGTNTVARTTSTSILTLGGSYNSLIVSNGAKLFEAAGAGNQGYLSAGGFNNKLIVTGTGSVFTVGGTGGIFFDYGAGGGTNQFIIADGGLVVAVNTTFQLDPGMQLLVTGGGGLTNTGNTYPLVIGKSGNGAGASAIVSDGGYIINTTAGAIIGLGAAGTWASNSTLLVTGAGSVLSNAGTLWISQYGSDDTLTIANSGTVFSTTGNIGVNSTSSFNAVTLTDTGSVWRNSGAINVGGVQINTYNNQLIISNGALVTSGSGGIGGGSSQAKSNSVTVTGLGSTWTNAGALTIGGAANDNWNGLTVTNGGTYVGGGAITVGTGGTSNTLAILGAASASTFSNNGLVTIGSAGGGFNTLTATNANLWSAGLTVGSGASNNTVTVLKGATWDLLAGNVSVGTGAATGNVLRIEGGAALTNIGTLWLTNNLNQIQLNGGTLSLRNAFVSNQVFTVGDGVQAATLQSLVGTQIFASGLLIQSNATLRGTGTIRGTTILTNGATIAPGTLNVQDLIWYGGGSYSNVLVDFAASPGTGWNYINGSGALTFSNNAEKFILRLDSGGGLAANFNSTLDYTLAIAGFNNGVTNFDAARFTIDTNAFANPFGGTFGVSLAGTNLYLTYAGLTITPNFTWTNSANGSWSSNSVWLGVVAPPVNGSATQVLQFNGAGTASYIATNDRTTTGLAGSFTNNQLVLNSNSTGTNTLAGATLTWAGTAPLLYQKGSGMFIISNAVQLAADTTFRGPGLGSVVLASNITGTGAITKNGVWNLTLQGSNSFGGPVLLDSSGGTLTLQNQFALGTNSVTVSNGTLFVSLGTTAYRLGNGFSNQTILITGTGAYWTNSANLVIGSGAATGNTLRVENGGSVNINGAIGIGTNGAALNSLVISKGGRLFTRTTASFIGFDGASNSATIQGGTGLVSLWDNGGQALTIGVTNSSAAAGNNSLVVDGAGAAGSALLTNVAGVTVGANGSGFNSLIITNGGKVWESSGGLTIGNGTSNNWVLVMGGGGVVTSVFQVGSSDISMGANVGPGTGNVLRIDGAGVTGGAVVSNVANINMRGSQNTAANSIIITNGGVLVHQNLTVGSSSSSNLVLIVAGSGGAVSTLKSTGNIVIGTGTANGNSLRIDGGGFAGGALATGATAFIVGAANNPGFTGNSLIITNGGQLFIAPTSTFDSFIGQRYNTNFVTVTGANSLLNLGGRSLIVGVGSATGNVLRIENGGLLTNVNILSISPSNAVAVANQIIVSNGTVFAQNIVVGGAAASQTGNQLLISGSSLVTVTTALVVTNSSGGNTVVLNGGVLNVANTVYSNSQNFVIGDGTQSATLNLLGGTHLFQNNLVVTNNAVLAGTGNLTVAGGNGTVSILNNSLLSPGSSPGTLTITGTNLWDGGGRYLWQISDFTGAAGGGTDLVLATWFNIAANSGNKFIIDINSLTPTNTSGVAANFNKDSSYTLILAQSGGAGQVLNFDAGKFSLVTSNFQNAFDGLWRITSDSANIYLSYEGATNFVWNNVTGSFATGSNWKDNVAPPTATTNLVMYFGGAIGQATYTASNGITGLVTKRIVLTNQSANAQFIIGNSITLAGVAPEIQQNQSGQFIISNNLVLATNTLFTGTGSGALRVDGSISGAASLTKTGMDALVLGGANTYSGNTIIQQGQVLVANAAALSSSVVSNLVDGGLGFTGLTAVTVGGLAGSGAIGLTNTAGAGVGLTIAGGGTYGGGLSGSGSLTKTGSGTETLSGTNTYTGTTLVQAGILAVSGQLLGSTNLLVTGGQFNWNSPTAMTNGVGITVNSGGTVSWTTDGTIDALTGTGRVNLNANTLQVGFAGASTNFAGAVSGAGTLSKVGSGTWTLTGAGNLLGNVAVNAGTLALDGGSLTATNFVVSGSGQFALNSGTLTFVNGAVSNGSNFLVGNGSRPTTLSLLNGGTAIFQNNLIISSNATLQGAANIVVASGQGAVVIQAGGTQAIGGAPGTLTITGTNLWQGGGQWVWDINNFTGSPGSNSGWDWLNVVGVLSNGATALNPFVINLTSLSGSSAGWAANFNTDTNYQFTIATAALGVTNFTDNFRLAMGNFQNPYDGQFTLAVQQGTNLVLTYTGSDVYTWKDGTGNFSNANNWVTGQVPTIGRTNVVLVFGGSTNGSYTAHNDLNNLLTKRIVLSNTAPATTQYIVGNPFTFTGINSELAQTGAGAVVISNALTLADTLTADGSGGGPVTLAGDLSGSGGLTKAGPGTLVLAGSNTYSGVTIVNDGHLFIASSDALSGSTLSNRSAGAVVFTNLTTARWGGLAGNVDLGLTNTAGTGVALVVGGNNQNTSYGGILSGSGSLTKTGTGSLILTNRNTYSGVTIVNAGTLIAGWLPTGLGGSGSSLGTNRSLFLSGGTLRVGVTSLLTVTNPIAGSVSLTGGNLESAGVVNLGHITNLGSLSTIASDLSNQGNLDVNNGTLVILGNLVNTGVISNRATLKIGANGTGWMTNAGQIVLVGGTVAAVPITNAGLISGSGTLAAAVDNRGLVSASGSNQWLTIAGAATGTGTYRAESGATLAFNGGGQVSSLFNTGATLRVAGGILTNTSAFRNSGGTLALSGGGYQVSLQFTNTGWLVGAGSFNSAAALVNAGTIQATGGTLTPLVFNSNLVNTATGYVTAPSGALQINGTFTNNGTLQVISGVGTYNNQVVNNNVWLTDHGTSTFQETFLITTNGYVAATAGDKYVFKSDLLNHSTNSAFWSTLGVTPASNPVDGGVQFLFTGSSQTQTQRFEHPGLLLTGGFAGTPTNTTEIQFVSGEIAGFSNNFAIGELLLTNTTLVLAQSVPQSSLTNALFVNDLFLYSSTLVISNDMRVYFVNSNAWSLANITLLGNAEIHQLSGLGAAMVIPEPNVLLMWLCGGITFWAARRRARQKRSLR